MAIQINMSSKKRPTNPGDAQSHPGYKEMVAKAPERMAKLKFDTEGERRDYLKKIDSNPNNVHGLPPFFPPLEIKSHLSAERCARECECGGCATYPDGFACPRCGMFVEPKQ